MKYSTSELIATVSAAVSLALSTSPADTPPFVVVIRPHPRTSKDALAAAENVHANRIGCVILRSRRRSCSLSLCCRHATKCWHRSRKMSRRSRKMSRRSRKMSRRRRLTYHHWLGIDDKIACSLMLKLMSDIY